MTREELTAEASRWIGEILDRDPPPLRDDTDLVRDVGLDSLGLAELAARVRSRHRIRLRPSELRNDLRVGPLIHLVLSRIKDAQ
jgi:acyl carrier protein